MDTVRGAETVPADPDFTPTLADLAGGGTEYTNAIATAPWTMPVHGSLFTGAYPARHGAHAGSTFLDDRLPTLAELFRGAGYETMAVSNNTWVADEFGFARGFETFVEQAVSQSDLEDGTRIVRNPGPGTDDWNAGERGPGTKPWSVTEKSPLARVADRVTGPRPTGSDVGGLGGLWRRLREGLRREPPDNGADRTVRRVRRWLETREDDRPFFLFVNLIEPHLHYRPPRDYAERYLPDGWSYEAAMDLPQDPRAFDAGEFDPTEEEWAVMRGLYRGEIAYLDAQLDRLRAAIEAAGQGEETLLVVTGDHGENVGEHGFLGHQYSLYDTLLHVPLVVDGGAFRGGAPGADELVQSVDLAPTLLDAAGIEAADARREFQGASFHPSAGGLDRQRAFAEYYGPRPPVERLEERFGDLPDRLYDLQRSLRAVRTRRYKYVQGSDGSEWLYDLETDPVETEDLADDAPGLTADLASALEGWRGSFEDAPDPEAVEIDPSTEQRLSNLGYM